MSRWITVGPSAGSGGLDRLPLFFPISHPNTHTQVRLTPEIHPRVTSHPSVEGPTFLRGPRGRYTRPPPQRGEELTTPPLSEVRPSLPHPTGSILLRVRYHLAGTVVHPLRVLKSRPNKSRCLHLTRDLSTVLESIRRPQPRCLHLPPRKGIVSSRNHSLLPPTSTTRN